MDAAKGRVAAFLIFALSVTPASAAPISDAVDDSGVASAYGTIVDTITVTGNRNTKDYVILRELETQVGDVLEPEVIHRDIRFIGDLSPFATVTAHADSISPGHCALRLEVTERSAIFLKSILPYFKYDFESGVTYGMRWKDNNFRGRLEQLNFTYQRNERGDNNVSFSWGAPWIGWKHISIGGVVSYYNRGDNPREISVLERTGLAGSIALPLTESRIRFSQLIGSLSLDKTLNGSEDTSTIDETLLSPVVGYRFDSRDSQLRPETGQTALFTFGTSLPLKADRDISHWVRGRGRAFFHVADKSVIALLSDVFYQFGDFPEYALAYLGGSGTLRGHPDSRFSGFHRWFGTVEWRYLYLPRRVVPVPFVKQVDVGLGFVTFIDTGIVWDDVSDFTFGRVHGTGGFGVRFYTPLRDVFRMDFGFNGRGDARFHFGTGIRF